VGGAVEGLLPEQSAPGTWVGGNEYIQAQQGDGESDSKTKRFHRVVGHLALLALAARSSAQPKLMPAAAVLSSAKVGAPLDRTRSFRHQATAARNRSGLSASVRHARDDIARDRKSTRLNSSHD